MYGVVVCSKCRRAKGASLSKKTTTCQCGNKIMIKGARVRVRTKDARDLAVAVASENARLRGGLEEYRQAVGLPRRIGGVHGRVAEEASKAAKKDEKIMAVAANLTLRLGAFSEKDFVLVLTSMGIAKPREHLNRLVELSLVFEPEPGRFKAV